jgi:hypothetical protein
LYGNAWKAGAGRLPALSPLMTSQQLSGSERIVTLFAAGLSTSQHCPATDIHPLPLQTIAP